MGLDLHVSPSFIDACLQDGAPPGDDAPAPAAQTALLPPELTGSALMQVVHDGVFIAQDGRFIHANPALAALLGYSSAEFAGMPFERVIAPEFLSLWKHRFARRIGAGDPPPASYRLRLLKRDPQDEVWVELQACRFTCQGRRSVLGLLKDVTEQRRAQQRCSLRDHVLERLGRGAGLDSLLHAIVYATEEVVPHMRCGVLLLDPRDNLLHCGAAPSLPEPLARWLDGLALEAAAGDCGLATAQGEELAGARLRERCGTEFAAVLAQAGIHAGWSAPVLDDAGQLAGVFSAYYDVPGPPSHSDVALLREAVSLAAMAVARRRAEEELQLASLVYQTSTEGMMVLDAQGHVLAVNPAFLRMTGYASSELLGVQSATLPLLRDDPSLLPALRQALETQGQWQGEVWSHQRGGEPLVCWVTVNTSRDAAGQVQRRVALFSDITNRKQSEELIWRQANFDLLTQLPNRNMLHDRLSQDVVRATQQGRRFAVLSIDLDKFKEVNDALGPVQGDQLLVATARRILRRVGAANTVARMGGNEFVAVMPLEDGAAPALPLASTLLEQLTEPYHLPVGPTVVHASVGVAVYPDDAATADSLLTSAAHAMRIAKGQGGNRCCQFTLELAQAAQARAQLVKDLRDAVQEQQFELLYQPIVDLRTGEVHKAEALLRWNHPRRGVISPAEFIPLAEETGLIVDIGNWVFQEATRWVKDWRRRHDPAFRVSINKSPAQFDRSGAGTRAWLEHLRALGLPGEAVVVEITEGLLLHSEAHVADTMAAYRAAGMQLAIDDFGTGYSALSYLKKFDIDHLKIDQSFTRHLGQSASDRALCEAMVVMAHRLGLSVVAEGLESQEHRQLLLDMGCDCGQGYLYTRPLSAPAFEKLYAD